MIMGGTLAKMLGFYCDEDPSHMSNRLDCLRGRKQPDRTAHHGFAQSVACMMATGAYGSGKKIYQKAEAVLDSALTG